MVRYDAYAHLSDESRLDRFCAIMAKAVFLAEERDRKKLRGEQAEEQSKQSQESAVDIEPSRRSIEFERPTSTTDRIIDFLADVGEASPRDIQNKHYLSRSKTYRLLTELREAGKVQQLGQTRSVRYRLAG
ncbi:MAG: hypothetical protein Q7Q73_08460 [Verrucomicrobiota bacterium JB024]|nr:hypothetical protein [Verrucomicrobiota bacterium JB024]